MTRPLSIWLGLGAVSLLRAAAPSGTDAVIVAAVKLSDQPNYSWTSTVTDDARTYDVEGKTQKGGFTRVKSPVVNSVRRRLGRSVTDTQVELIFKGNVRCVIGTEEGWKSVDELPRPESREPDVLIPPQINSRIINKPPPPRRDEIEVGPYSNLQLAICHPHEELGVIVTSHTNIKLDGDIATGTLNDLGAQLLLVHDGQTEIQPLRAAGTFKLWLRGGQIARYQVKLEGILLVTTSVGRREINVHQTIDTTLKAIGTTTVDVPDEAKRKLGP